MKQDISECDQLRQPDRICAPDSRTRSFVRIDERSGRAYQNEIADQYEAIARFVLNDAVPESVAIHFETSKNLYLYSWFVFRFYPVAEQQALASLEFGLRERFPEFVKENLGKRGFGLWMLLKHAIENGHIKNELFTTRERWAWNRAEMRHSTMKAQEVINAGLESVEWSESEVIVTQEDLDCDWLKIFQETIPKMRNEYAHGSKELKHGVLHTFEMVVELINQLYSNEIRECL